MPAQRCGIDGMRAIGGAQHHHLLLSPGVEAVPQLHELVLDARGGLMLRVSADAQKAVYFICGRPDCH